MWKMTSDGHSLHPYEELMLLALRDDKGTLESKASMYQYALGGAILTELAMNEVIRIRSDKKMLVDHVSSRHIGDPILDECLELVSSAKRRRLARDWVERFGTLKRLRHRVAEGLCRKGILKDSEDSVLFIFTRKTYPTIDPGPESEIIGRLREAIFGHSAEVEPGTAIVASLANATGLLPVHFGKKDLKTRKRRLEELASGDLVGVAAAEAVRAAQAAAIAAISAATVATTATG
jgi:hypothetical protein